jgi:hypothetical protein
MPYLTKSMLKDALVKIRKMKMKYPDSCVQGLAAISHYLAEPLKEKVLNEALALAQTLEDVQSKFHALLHVLPNLPEPLRKQVEQEMLSDIRATAKKTKEEC